MTIKTYCKKKKLFSYIY